MIQHGDEKLTHRFVGISWRSIDNCHTHAAYVVVLGKILLSSQHFTRLHLPHRNEYQMEVVHRSAFNMHVHISPRTYFLDTRDVVISHIHASCVRHSSVYHHNLAVVSRKNVIHPGEPDGVEQFNLDALLCQIAMLLLFHGLIVRHVAKIIIHDAHFHAFTYLFQKQTDEQFVDGVVSEI